MKKVYSREELEDILVDIISSEDFIGFDCPLCGIELELFHNCEINHEEWCPAYLELGI